MAKNHLAIIADIHGNIWALDAVLQDIEQRGIKQIINLGDSLYGSLEPAQTADRLIAYNIPGIMGNQDRMILDEHLHSADQTFIHQQLTPHHIAWVRSQPSTLIFDEVFCCHGTPTSDITALIEDITPHGVFLKSTAALEQILADISQPVIACGHTHVPHLVVLSDGRLVINPGSVGVPAYEDDLPYPHKMEAGSPHARYAILEKKKQGWHVDLIAIPYDWQAASQLAVQRGRLDRARWIQTGRG